MANVVKKYSISFELAQKMVNAAVAKARELGVTENVAILDDGGNLKAFRLPPSSRIATFSATPISLAFASASATIFCASSKEMLCFVTTLAIGLLLPLDMLIGVDSLAQSRSMQRERELPSAGGLAAVDGKDMSRDE